MNSCSVSLETLLDYWEQRLSRAESERLAEHLAAGCAHCAARRASFERVTRALGAGRFEAPSTAALEDACGILGRRRPSVSWIEQVAKPVVLPLRESALMAVRDQGQEPVQLLFETQEHDIDLWAEPEELGHYYVIGQVRSRLTGQAEQPLLMRLVPLQAPEQERVILPDPQGEFHLSALPAGRYSMVICLSSGSLRLETVLLPRHP